MPELALIDNDIALKVCLYSLVDEFIVTTATRFDLTSMLSVGRYVIRGRAERTSTIIDKDRALADIDRLLSAIELIEPDDTELLMAAELEAKASHLDLELDNGESQLLAVMANRGHKLFITGDKRAICAMSVVAPEISRKRIACLEQLITWMTSNYTIGRIRESICKHPMVDKAVTICFSCRSNDYSDANVTDALLSYIRDLDRQAPSVLHDI